MYNTCIKIVIKYIIKKIFMSQNYDIIERYKHDFVVSITLVTTKKILNNYQIFFKQIIINFI